MRLRWLAAVAFGFMAALAPASAQRGPNFGDNWEMLGRQTVGFGQDRDSIRISENEGFFRDKAFRALRFVAEGNDVTLNSITIIYINGHAEDIRIDRTIRRGGDLVVDLPGERSFLRQIDMRYRGNIGLSIGGGGIRLQQATVSVYGERASRRGPPPVEPSRPMGWVEVDTRNVSLQDSRVEFRSSRGDGRFGQIKVRAENEALNIRGISIRFRNGEVQRERVEQRLEPGQDSRPIDLSGDRRGLESVTVDLEPRRRPGRASLSLLGTERPGREDGPGSGPGAGRPDPYAGRGLVLLGEQTVGFAGDRDVVQINDPGDPRRERAYRRLHLVAERNEIYMQSVRVVYMNGYAEDYRLDRRVAAGTDTTIDLRGERAFVQRIELNYRSRPSFRGQAVMKVYGELARR